MHLQRQADVKAHEHEGYSFRRLCPGRGGVDTLWGGGWTVVKPGERTSRVSVDL
jgi:hypothetical protein